MKHLIYIIALISFPVFSFADDAKFIKFRSNSEEPKQLESFVSQKIGPPDSYIAISNNKFLVSITSVGRIGQGLYFVDLSIPHIERVVGGFPELKQVIRNESLAIFVLANMGLNRGQMWTQYYALIFPHSKAAVSPYEMNNLIYVVEDGESSQCGSDKNRARAINLSKATKISSYSLSNQNNNSIPDIIFDIDEMDCQSWEKRSYQTLYKFKNGKYEKQIIQGVQKGRETSPGLMDTKT